MTLDRIEAADSRQIAEQMVEDARRPELTNLQFVVGIVAIVAALALFAWLLG